MELLSANEYYLLGIWTFAALVSLTPMFVFSGWKKLLVIPLLFAAVYLSFDSNRKLLATPWYGEPTGEFVTVHHKLTNINDVEHVVLWASTDKERLYIFPATKQNKQKLEEAQQAREQGMAMIGKFVEKSTRDSANRLTRYPILEMRPIDYEKDFPKEK